jgi:hypothetical protein
MLTVTVCAYCRSVIKTIANYQTGDGVCAIVCYSEFWSNVTGTAKSIRVGKDATAVNFKTPGVNRRRR